MKKLIAFALLLMTKKNYGALYDNKGRFIKTIH